MKVVCWLNMGQPDMAKAEVLTLLQAKEKEKVEDLLIIETGDWQPGKRLAFTRALYEFWWSCPVSELWDTIDHCNWNKLVQGSFSVSLHHAKIPVKKVADRVWHWVKDPIVKLKNPDTPINFFFVKDKVYCCKFLWANKEEFNERKPQNRTAFRPVSCDARTARALVNLTGAPQGASVLDPFCGTGGLLIEAALMGLHARGSDIDSQMIIRSQQNCDQRHVECELSVKDALHLYSPEKYVATDLPFGKNTGAKTKKELEDLYAGFLERLDEFLRVRAVLTFPHTIQMERLVKKTSLRIVGVYSQFIHRSLTRKIIVLEPGKKEAKE